VGLGGVAAECSFVFFFEEGVGEELLSFSLGRFVFVRTREAAGWGWNRLSTEVNGFCIFGRRGFVRRERISLCSGT
jgi:hypothetical protein